MRSRTVVIVACLALATFMGRLDTNIVTIALPTIAKTFDVLPGASAILMLAYMLTQAVLLIPFGSLGDRMGFRRLLLTGYAAFTLGSLLCGLSPSIHIMTAARVIQGIGAAMLLIASFSIISQELSPDQTGSAMGALTLAGSLGILCGAPLGGILTEHLGWKSIFFINIPFGVAALVLGSKSLKPDHAALEKNHPPFDWPGAIFGAGWALLFTLGLNSLHGHDTWLTAAGLLAAGGGLLFLFIRHMRRCAHPLIDLGVFKIRHYTTSLISRVLIFTALACQGFTLPFLLHSALGFSTQETGLTIALFPVGTSVAGPLAGRLADRISPRPLATAALIMGAVVTGLFAFSLHLNMADAVYFYLPCIGLCFGAFLTLNAKLMLTGLPRKQQGTATSVFHTSSNLALLLGIAAGSLIFSWSLGDKTGPDTVPLYLPVYAFNTVCYLTGTYMTADFFHARKHVDHHRNPSPVEQDR